VLMTNAPMMVTQDGALATPSGRYRDHSGPQWHPIHSPTPEQAAPNEAGCHHKPASPGKEATERIDTSSIYPHDAGEASRFSLLPSAKV